MRLYNFLKKHTSFKFRIGVVVFFALFFLGVSYEIKTSALQSWFLSRYAEKLSYTVDAGPSEHIVFPKSGPFNKRRGYTRIPDFQDRLKAKGYYVKEQSRFTPQLINIAKRGLTPPFQEPVDTGLVMKDSKGRVFYDARKRNSQFNRFEDIPPIVVKTLLFIEDRELGNPKDPRRNPVIDWDRLVKSGMLYAMNKVGFPVHIEGGSTLATQLEKYRYSPHGLTSSVFDKFRQMSSASLKVYKTGVDTRKARKDIILNYLNSAPLSAPPGYGEVYGIGEGLHAWFNLDLNEVSQALFSQKVNVEKIKAFKSFITLLCAVRAPTYYLLDNNAALEKRVLDYIQLLHQEGVIDTDFAAKLRKEPIVFSPGKYKSLNISSGLVKSTNYLRTELLQTLGISNYYELDRLQMEVESTIDLAFQEKIAKLFQKLQEPDFVTKNGLRGKRLLSHGDIRDVTYSFLLFEKTDIGNVLRVHADNLDQPFDINSGMKLELGSTAKLRTLAHYLEIVARLHYEFSFLDRDDLKEIEKMAADPITRWAAETLRKNKDIHIDAFLSKALDRKYSASPWEVFFTGGGIHTFSNFNENENYFNLPVREATIHSTNLVYIRLMRDLVRYHKARLPYNAESLLKDPNHPQRFHLLKEIADEEAKKYLRRFYKKYHNVPKDKLLSKFLKKRANSKRRLAILYFAWRQKMHASMEDLFQWLNQRNVDVTSKEAYRLYKSYSNPRLTISDYGYLLRKHPLEVWLAGQFFYEPNLTWDDIVTRSYEERYITSLWLFKSRNIRAQNLRIRIRIEEDAFKRMTPYWQRLGFPFERLVPSYATSIGSSSDRPAALAELVGIIVNNGMQRHTYSIRKLRFADDTPYYTYFALSPQTGERVMAEPVARALKNVLKDVVERGTARRVNGAIVNADGLPVTIGGKTGSGDNRVKQFNRYGGLLTSKALNRTATFVFYIGDRYFGVITAFVSGREAEEYRFTSSLPVTILKLMAPVINSHLKNQLKHQRVPIKKKRKTAPQQTIAKLSE